MDIFFISTAIIMLLVTKACNMLHIRIQYFFEQKIHIISKERRKHTTRCFEIENWKACLRNTYFQWHIWFQLLVAFRITK